jgi:hypothetical protein
MRSWRRAFAFPAAWAMLAALVIGSSAPVFAQEIRLAATLSGPAIFGVVPFGSAEFEDENPQGKFKAEVQDVNLPDNTILVVTLNGSFANGAFTSEALIAEMALSGGQGRVELQGPMDALQPGTMVQVWTHDGTLLLSGPLQ